MTNEYFCIFAGGGVRGTAYLGVLQVLEEMDIKISGLAGSSVGAIFASLYAAGYSSEEMKEIIFNINYEAFRDLYFPFGKDFGICKGENLFGWLKNCIEKKFYGDKYKLGAGKPVTFKDLDKDLVIIATNISETSFQEFSKYKSPDMEVAQAVRASVSIPGFFKPVWEKEGCLVDGDIICNFPLWSLSTDSSIKNNKRVLEFRLEGSEKPKQIKNPFDYFSALLDTHYNVATDILLNNYSHNDQFEIIKIDAGKVKVIDFTLSNSDKQQLIQNGYDSATKYFKYDLVKKKKHLIYIYKQLLEYLNKFKQEILKNKIHDSFITLAELSIFVTENNHIIHKEIYNQLIDLRKHYCDSLLSIKFLRIQVIRHKKYLNSRLEFVLNYLDNEMSDMKDYIDKQTEKRAINR